MEFKIEFDQIQYVCIRILQLLNNFHRTDLRFVGAKRMCMGIRVQSQ